MDIQLLDASSEYRVKNKTILYEKSLLFPIPNVKKEDIYEDIYNNFNKILKNS